MKPNLTPVRLIPNSMSLSFYVHGFQQFDSAFKLSRRNSYRILSRWSSFLKLKLNLKGKTSWEIRLETNRIFKKNDISCRKMKIKHWLSSHLTTGEIPWILEPFRKEGQSRILVSKLFNLCLPGSSFKGRIPGREICGPKKLRHWTGLSVTAILSYWKIADRRRKYPSLFLRQIM